MPKKENWPPYMDTYLRVNYKQMKIADMAVELGVSVQDIYDALARLRRKNKIEAVQGKDKEDEKAEVWQRPKAAYSNKSPYGIAQSGS